MPHDKEKIMSMDTDSRWYIQAGEKKIPVSENVFREYMRMTWREQKQRERQNRCPRLSGIGVCRKDCSSCPCQRQPVELSLEVFQELYDIESPILTEEVCCRKELHRFLRQAVETLPEQERMVVLWYAQGMSQRQMALRLSLTAARICQIKSCALRKLKKLLREWT